MGLLPLLAAFPCFWLNRDLSWLIYFCISVGIFCLLPPEIHKTGLDPIHHAQSTVFLLQGSTIEQMCYKFCCCKRSQAYGLHPVNLSRASPLLDSPLYSIRDQCMLYKDWHTLCKDSLNQHILEGLSGLDTSIFNWFNKFQPHLKFIYFWFWAIHVFIFIAEKLVF